MEYERIHKVQMVAISPTKLRMKLLGPHSSKKKEGSAISSRTTSPSKLEEMEFAKNSLLATHTDREDSSKNSKGSSLLNSDETSEEPKSEMSVKGKADVTLATNQSISKNVPYDVQYSNNSSSVHPVRSLEEDGNDYDSGHDNASTSSFEFHRVERASQHMVNNPFFRHLPSKWNDAEKWLVNRQTMQSNVLKKNIAASQGNHHVTANWGRVMMESLSADPKHFAMQTANVRRNELTNPASPSVVEKFSFPHCLQSTSRSLNETSGLTDVSQLSDDSYSTPRLQKEVHHQGAAVPDNKSTGTPVAPIVHSVCMRDIGTEMTPIPSQEPSRTGTPIDATTPTRSPISSLPSTPKLGAPAPSPAGATKVNELAFQKSVSQIKLSERELQQKTKRELVALGIQLGKMNIASWASKDVAGHASPSLKVCNVDQCVKAEYETRAASWEEAEMSKNMARYKHEEVKIQAWEKQQNAKIEAEMKKIEAQAEQMKAHAQEWMLEKLAVTRRRVVEKQAAAEARKNQQAAKTAQQVDEIRQTGHLPYSHHRCCSRFF